MSATLLLSVRTELDTASALLLTLTMYPSAFETEREIIQSQIRFPVTLTKIISTFIQQIQCVFVTYQRSTEQCIARINNTP